MEDFSAQDASPQEIEDAVKIVRVSGGVPRFTSVDDLLIDLEKEAKALSWISSPFWFVRFKLIGGLFYLVKRAVQVLRNGGFPDDHVFELGYFACKWVLPRLDKFIASHNGWPDSDFASDKAYTEALGDVRFFLNAWADGNLDWDDKAQVERFQKGKKLSHLVFTLWD